MMRVRGFGVEPGGTAVNIGIATPLFFPSGASDISSAAFRSTIMKVGSGPNAVGAGHPLSSIGGGGSYGPMIGSLSQL